MGTEVQTKMHLLGYHSTRDLSDNASRGDWPLYHKSKALKNGRYHDWFSTEPSSVAFPGHDKETLRQTILKHEAVFRHQLHELHRLYKKQMDLMDGIRTSKLHSHYSLKAETLDCELLESKHKKHTKVFIDLELPADEYIGSEEEHLHVSAVSCNQSLRSGCKGDSSKPKSYLRRSNGLTDLNEPVLFGKTSTSASVDIPIQTNGTTACSKEDTQRWNLSANLHSAFKYLGKELPNFHRGRDGVISNLHLQNGKNKNECLTYSPEHRQTSSYRNNLYRTVLQNSVIGEHATVLPTDHRNKRTIFGVEISDRDQKASVVASQAVGSQSPGSHSDFANSKPLFVSTQSRRSSALNQFSTAMGHHCSTASAYEPFAKHGQENYFRGLEYLKDAKSTRYRNEAPYQQHFALNDLQKKHENPQGGLCWLRDMMRHKSEASKEKANCSDLGLLQMSQFATVTGERKSLSRCLSQDHGCEVGRNKVVGNSVKLESFEIDDSQIEEQPKAKDHGLNKGLVDHNTNFRYHIDLNICMTEEVEEAQLTPSSPKIDVNFSAKIDLEMAVAGAETGATPEVESPESTLKGPCKEPHEEHIRDAAEALVAISSSRGHDLDLVWFADLVSLYKDDIDGNDEQDLDETDYFEMMTLGLTETKVEEYSFEPQDQGECKDENVFTKRPRRGQARRGRQSKDFQRDVLPGLVTLSRYEVKEDLQIIEGLVGASLTQRNGAKGGRGRGRRSSGGSTTSPKATPEQPRTHASIVEEKSLVSWGKRTRRLRRQRSYQQSLC